MLLAALTLAFALIFGGNALAASPGSAAASPSSAPAASAPARSAPANSAPAVNAPQASFSKLPPTQPGLSNDEGAFLVTTADDGSQAVYFIAGNSRHSILWTDMQIELQLNPLWPVFTATAEQVEGFPEGAAIGAARTGLVGGGDAPQPQPQPAAAAGQTSDAQPAAAPRPEPQPAAGAAAETDSAAAPAPDAQPAAGAATDTEPAAAADAQPSVVADTSDAAQPAATYTLRTGDNLTRIAARFGTSVDAILAANGVTDPNRIYAGQTLAIPSSGDDTALADAPAQDTPAEADTTATADAPAPAAATAQAAPQYAPAQASAPAQPDAAAHADADAATQTDAATQADAADQEDAPVEADVPVGSGDSDSDVASADDSTTYTVQRGDSAIKIARRFGIDEGTLLDANSISNPNRVYVGQVLTIPGSSS